MDYYLGIDPGKTGAFAIVNDDLSETHVWTADVSTEMKKSLMLEYKPRFAALELVRSMNTWKKSSIESLNRSAGHWQGIIETLDIAYTEVTPSAWQLAVMRKRNSGDKKVTLEFARRFFPLAELPLMKDADKGDALCIAYYAYLHINQKLGRKK